MKVVGVIPARYQSTRFPGKPLADICGKPMIWWVYQRVKLSKRLSEIYVLTDDERIKERCEQFSMSCLMTRNDHPNHISRVYEASCHILADWYICINGDEPLIEWEAVDSVIPDFMPSHYPEFYGAARELNDAVKVIDPANIKIALNCNGQALYISRTSIPFPKGTLDFKYKKYVGIECFNRLALDFFVHHPMGELEKIEDIDHLRFLENGVPLHFKIVDTESLSVDTPKDLEYVRKKMSQIQEGNG